MLDEAVHKQRMNIFDDSVIVCGASDIDKFGMWKYRDKSPLQWIFFKVCLTVSTSSFAYGIRKRSSICNGVNWNFWLIISTATSLELV